MIEKSEGDVAETFENCKTNFGLPFVPNLFKVLASSESALDATWGIFRNVFGASSLPQSLVLVLLYSVAAAHNCQYCSAAWRAGSMSTGIDNEILDRIAKGLEALSPRRTQAIIKFAVKVAQHPVALVETDFTAICELGVSDHELIDIITIAASASYLDILADALKMK